MAVFYYKDLHVSVWIYAVCLGGFNQRIDVRQNAHEGKACLTKEGR